MDRLGNIEAFVAAADLGSFARAARKLRITPSAVSRRVQQLEDDVGVRLLHRTTRVLRLSDEGRTFLERCRSALRELREAQDAASKRRDRPAGLLRVEAPTVLGRLVVVPALTRLVARHRELEVEMLLRDQPGDAFADGIDLSVRMGALEDSALIARRLGRSRMRVCASPSYLRRHGVPRTVDALLRHERIGFMQRGRVIDWRLRDGDDVRDLAPGRRIVVDHGDALIDLAVSGAGVAWMCDFMSARAEREKKLVEVLAETCAVELPVHAVMLPTRQLLPKVRAFVDVLVTELKACDVGG